MREPASDPTAGREARAALLLTRRLATLGIEPVEFQVDGDEFTHYYADGDLIAESTDELLAARPDLADLAPRMRRVCDQRGPSH